LTAVTKPLCQRTLTLYKTKSGKPRGIPLTQDAIGALEAVEPDPKKRAGLSSRAPRSGQDVLRKRRGAN
jgi:hypothetical protein